MPALYTHTTRASGTILTASIYNSDHQNHITFGDAQYSGGWEASVGQMQIQTDPGEQGSESLGSSISDEIEQLRFAIKETKAKLDASVAYWYETPNRTDISNLPPMPPWYIEGLDLKAAVSSPGRFEVATGLCRSADNVMNLRVTTPLNRTVTAIWSTDAASGGRALAATLIARQLFHIFVFKTAASTVDIGADSVLTASNLMARASATHYRRIGSMFAATNGGGLLPNHQRDGYVAYTGGADLTNPSFTVTWQGVTTFAAARVPLVPSGYETRAQLAVGRLSLPPTTIVLRIADGQATGVLGGAGVPIALYLTSDSGPPVLMWHHGTYWTSPSADVQMQANTATVGCQVLIRTLSYHDRRR